MLNDLMERSQKVKAPDSALDVPLSGYDRLLQDFISQKQNIKAKLSQPQKPYQSYSKLLKA